MEGKVDQKWMKIMMIHCIQWQWQGGVNMEGKVDQKCMKIEWFIDFVTYFLINFKHTLHITNMKRLGHMIFFWGGGKENILISFHFMTLKMTPI